MTAEGEWTAASAVVTFRRDGFVVGRGVLTHDEAISLRAHFATVHDARDDLVEARAREAAGDERFQWPRILAPHASDPRSRALLVDRRLMGSVATLVGATVLGLHTMWYWKPPGALGQALHRDEHYVRSDGGPCVAAWVAMDRCTEENGCLHVVPGSHLTPDRGARPADPTSSFSSRFEEAPAGLSLEPVLLEVGDVVFFDGRLLHGSEPNHSTGEWRRTFVAHYLPASVRSWSEDHGPLHDETGTPVRSPGAST